MKRVVVVGAPGSGKTTLARKLAAATKADYIELDAILHGERGQEPSPATFRSRLLPLLDADSWVVDGWHERMIGTLAMEKADTVIFLDPPLPLILARLVRRSMLEIAFRKELWNGNRQTFRGAFGGGRSLLGYAVRRHADIRKRFEHVRHSEQLEPVEWVHVRDNHEVVGWVQSRCDPQSLR